MYAVDLDYRDTRRLQRAAERARDSKAELDALIIELVESGASLRAVARALGVSAQAIHERKKRASERN